MTKFSDRIGVTNPPKSFQIDSMSAELRNSIWNLIYILIPIDYRNRTFRNFMTKVYVQYFKESVSKIPEYEEDCRRILEEKFMNLHWYEIYNLVELIYKILSDTEKKQFEKSIGVILKREYAGFSFSNGDFIQIISEEEIKSIKDAQERPINIGLKNISEHIRKAANLLSKKPTPDYHNSIKESISAVEGICKILSDEKKGGIKEAINTLSTKIQIHPALLEGYKKIYGFTSDEGGIRHPMLEDSTVGFAEAKYMLVSCSAFVNYIIDNAIKAKLI